MMKQFYTSSRSLVALLFTALISWCAVQPALSQTDSRRPATSRRLAAKAAPLGAKAADGQSDEKNAYGILCYDNSDIYYTNGLVSFPVSGSETLNHVTLFGDADHNVTAAAYANGYYYVERTVTQEDGETELPADLIRYDIDKNESTVVGEFSGFSRHISDMTFDNSEGKMYAISIPDNISSDLYVIDLSTAASEKVADLDRCFFTLACTYTGQLYGISFDGDLCKIDKTTGEVTLIGATGYQPTYFQSMEFDHSDGTLYWAAQISNSGLVGHMAKVDITTGAAELLNPLGDDAEICGLYIPFSAAAPGQPAAVNSFIVTPDAEGANKAELTWTNPTTTFDGTALTSLTAVCIYRDKQLIATLTDVKPGEEGSYTDVVEGDEKGAFHTYTILAQNEQGNGAETSVRVFVGRDIPASVTNLTLQVEGYDQAVLFWEQPATGTNGGNVDKASLVYKVVRHPDGKVLATDLTATTITDEAITPSRNYYYTVQAVNADGEAEAVSTDTLVLGPINTMPYSCDFTDTNTPDNWTMYDGNGDGYSWIWTVGSVGQIMGHQPSNTQVSDDWLVSYYIPFEAGTLYRVEYDLHAYSRDNLEFFLLENTDTLQKAQQIYVHEVEGSRETKRYSFAFVAEKSGNYTLAIHATSPVRADWLEFSSISVRKAESVNLALTELTGEASPMAKKETTFTATVSNLGAQSVPSYTVSLKSGDGEVLSTVAVNEPIAANTSSQVAIAWTPQDASVTQVVAEVACEGDELSTDNVSDTLAIEIREYFDGDLVSIGTESEKLGRNAPFDFYNQHAAALSIYSAEEIGRNGGNIVKIAWPYDATSQYNAVENAQVKVYMANTELENTSAGWIAEDELTLVCDTVIGLAEKSEGELALELQTPFTYTGKNLAVHTTLECDNYYSYVYFKQYYSPLEGNSSFVWGNYRGSAFDFTQSGHVDYYGYTPAVMLYLTDKQTDGIGMATTDAPAGYTLYDVSGRMVRKSATTADTATATSGLRPGIYIMTYKEAGQLRSRKLQVR